MVGAAALAVAIPVVMHVAFIGATLRVLDRSGGRGNWSDAVYRLTDQLMAADAHIPVIVLDWGIHYNLVGLSRGELQSVELFPVFNNPSISPAQLVNLLPAGRSRYVLHAQGSTNFPRARKRFLTLVQHTDIRLDRVISDRLGDPVFEIYSSGSIVAATSGQ